jgi:hypothetical protein
MKKLSTILILLTFCASFAQEKTIEYQDINWEKCDKAVAVYSITKTIFPNGINTEERYYLKEKQVIYIKNFKNKIKQGKFIYYTEGKISSEINFDDDLLIGDLKIYNKKGKLERTLNYDKARAFIKLKKERQDDRYYDESSLNEKQEPIFSSSNFKSLDDYIKKSIYINQELIDSGSSGLEGCDVFINKKGTIDDIVFSKFMPTNNCQVEIIRMLLENLKWKPATKNGSTVNCQFSVSIFFVIPEED